MMCTRVGINPEHRGTNPMADSQPAYAKKDPISMNSLPFRAEIRRELLGIGKILNNLISQQKFPAHYKLGEIDTKKALQELVVQGEKYFQWWFDQGVNENSSVTEHYQTHHGRIFEIDSEALKRQKKMNENLMKNHREFIVKSHLSEQSAGKIILTA